MQLYFVFTQDRRGFVSILQKLLSHWGRHPFALDAWRVKPLSRPGCTICPLVRGQMAQLKLAAEPNSSNLSKLVTCLDLMLCQV